jgi:DNA processing protein
MSEMVSPVARDVLTLTMAPGLGPVLLARLIRALGSADKVLAASPETLKTVEGIGPTKAKAIAFERATLEQRAREELKLASDLGVALVALGEPGYPPLLAEIPDAPPILYIRGSIDPTNRDRACVAIVGSRACTQYGMEQAERFASGLASNGVTVVSGGARGIDTACHRAAVRIGGRTIVVLGCGLSECYPPENKPFFNEIAAHHGAIISELPLRTPPNAENFPARNRIISGLSLGTIVIEAAKGSGSLITARQAVEEHNREVFAVPGRVDSPASEGTHELIKSGGAHLVTSPGDVISALEQHAWHQHHGTHAARYAHTPSDAPLFAQEPKPSAGIALNEHQTKIVQALASGPATADQLMNSTGLTAAQLRTELTMLEIRKSIKREGTRYAKA